MATRLAKRPADSIEWFVGRISPRKRPLTVYHYTSQRGLQGIVDTRAIWATDIWFLNDSKEFALALDLAREVLEERRKASTTRRDLGLYTVMTESLTQVGESHVFVASFSREGDQLSQWRGYCPKASGFAIGFRPAALVDGVGANQEFILAPCLYDAEKQRALLVEIVDEVLQASRALQTLEPDNSRRVLAEAHKLFSKLLSLAAPVLKHTSFAEESEWRLFSRPTLTSAAGLKFRSGTSMLVPYREIELAVAPKPVPIARIVVGPTPMPALAKQAVELFLARNGLAAIDVDASEIPFRDW